MEFNRQYHPKKSTCFIIMPYGKKKLSDGREFDWEEFYNKIVKKAIQNIQMGPKRADTIFGKQGLMETVWKGIQEAEIILADITGHNPNVLYELGLAHVIGKHVVLLSQKDENIPADIAYTRQIRYNLDKVGGEADFMESLMENVLAARAESSKEMTLTPLDEKPLFEKIDAKVAAIMPEFAIVVAIDSSRRKGLLNREDVTWSNLRPNLSNFLAEGKILKGGFVTFKGSEIKYSLIDPEKNPWLDIESAFPVGQSFEGEVVNYNPKYGAFVRMDHPINGLLHKSKIPGNVNLQKGDMVKVETVWLDPSKRRVELKFIEKAETPIKFKPDMPYSVGQKLEGTIVYSASKEGYMLVELPECTAILHISNMSQNFRSKFEQENIIIGSSVKVEVVEFRRNKLQLRDIELY